jgi:DNA repair protein RadD
MSSICRDAVCRWNGRILILAHVKELLQQAAEKLEKVCPEIPVGIYSVGLGSRDTLASIIIAGIQSAYRKAAELGHFHLLPDEGDGMYRALIADLKRINPQLRIIGFTATPFRLSSGPICGPENILNEICYEISVRELMVQGFLCPLIAKAPRNPIDTTNLHSKGGEFIANEVEALMDDDSRVSTACKEIVDYTQDRHSVLIFASGVQHGRHVAQALESHGQRVGVVFGDTLDFEREQTIAEFKDRKLKYLVNVSVLTTGFDAPGVDCVVMLRPTMSPGLYYQMLGRGFRLHPAKKNCLILDFGGNVIRHGPVDALKVCTKNSSDSGAAPAKECPQCRSIIAAGYGVCPDCGFKFPREKSRHEGQASTQGVLKGQVSTTKYLVKEVRYFIHTKRGAPADSPHSMRVEYKLGFNFYQSEWVCFEHGGFARAKAEAWWTQRATEPIPTSVMEAVELADAGVLRVPSSITVRSVAGEEFDRIVDYEWGEPTYATPEPEYTPANDEIPF